MAQQTTGKADVKTFLAGETMAAYAVVTYMTLGTNGIFVRPWQTDTQFVIGVTMSPASTTGESLEIILAAPSVKCNANASISAGSIVGPATDAAGRIVERGQAATTTAHVPILGLALQTGTLTNSVVEVLLQPFSANLQSA